ncbi:adrenodoxin, mitochondrial [Bufo gargarizans]|uniref:adrenodoxin, mitochondrial n=1 Tax=Bufo gargarizans TaxID=30331 RepID=UPI001CF1891D|nr:adrenodoxin, mitochondrial [Bufo gargarizans]
MAAVTRLLSGSRCLLARSRGGMSAVRRPLRAAGGCLWTGAARLFSSEDKVTVKFINRDGETIVAEGKVGESLLDLVVAKNLDIDGFGACEGTLACSTCHLIFEDHIFRQLEPVTDEEMDMLDLAYGLTEMSRLGCQICLQPFMNGMTVKVPEAVADVRQAVDMSKSS